MHFEEFSLQMQTYINEVAVVRAWHFGVWVFPTHTLPRLNSGLDTSTDVILPTASHRIARNLMIYSLNKPTVIFQVKIFRRRCRREWMEWVCIFWSKRATRLCVTRTKISSREPGVFYSPQNISTQFTIHTESWMPREPKAWVQQTFFSLPALYLHFVHKSSLWQSIEFRVTENENFVPSNSTNHWRWGWVWWTAEMRFSKDSICWTWMWVFTEWHGDIVI